MRETLKDYTGRIIGYLDHEPNGDIIARDFYFKILGKYEKFTDTTKDFYGRILYRGNMVGMLFSR